MNIKINEFVTEISDISSLDELLTAQLGQPCMILVKPDENTSYGNISDFTDFFRNAPFMTAAASDSIPEGFADIFDIVIPSENTDSYIHKLFKDKSLKQASEITNCFIAARKYPSDKVFYHESTAFYRLIADKAEVTSNE